MSPRLRAGRRAVLTLTLLTILSLGATAVAPATSAATLPRFMLMIGNVRDACTGALVGGAALIFTPLGAPNIPPGPPVRVVTIRGGWYAAIVTAGPYTTSVSAVGYTPLGGPNSDGDQDSVFTDRPNLVNYQDFVLHPPSPC
jgi:hypothetical protein